MNKLFLYLGVGVLFILFPSSIIAQTIFVKVKPISKYKFIVTNESEYNLHVNILDEERPLSSGHSLYFEREDINKNSQMKLIYKPGNYKAKDTRLAREESGLKLKWEKMEKVLSAYAERRGSQHPITLSEAFVAALGMPMAGDMLQHINLLEHKLKTNKEIYKAATENNRFSSNFTEINIYEYATKNNKGKEMKTGLTPRLGIDWSFPTRKQDLGDFWDRKSQDMSSTLLISYQLLPELRWGRSQHNLTSIHGFIAQESPSYGLKAGERTFYVGEDYVTGSSPNFVKLHGYKYTNLHINRKSIGGFVRMLFYPKIYIDLGAGYVFSNRINVRFNKKIDEKSIQHLPKPYTLDEYTFRTTGTLEGSKMYGLARIGFYLTSTQKERPAEGLALFLTAKIANTPFIESNENYHLYYIDKLSGNNIPQEVQIMEIENAKSKPELQFRIGVGLHF